MTGLTEPIKATGLKIGKVITQDVLHFTGGLRGHRNGPAWQIGPVKTEAGLQVVGSFQDKELKSLAQAMGLSIFGANETSLLDPHLPYSNWRPLIGPPQLKFMPDDSWGMISFHANSAGDKVWAGLARNLSIALRAAGLQLRNASDQYERQLVAALERGQKAGRRFSNTALTELHLACHSVLAEMASARDYLASMAARRVNASANIEALNRLQDWLGKPANAPANDDPLVRALKAATDKSADPWLTDLGDYRNLFLHRQPMGADEHARFLTLELCAGPVENAHVISMKMAQHQGSAETCEILCRLVELHRKLMRLADFAASTAPYPAEPPQVNAN